MFDIHYIMWYFLASERNIMLGEKNRIFQKIVLEWQLDFSPVRAHDPIPDLNRDGAPLWRIPSKDEISLFCTSKGDTVEHPNRYLCELTPGGKIGTYDPKKWRFFPLEESPDEYGLRLVRTHVSRVEVTREVGLVTGAKITFS